MRSLLWLFRPLLGATRFTLSGLLVGCQTGSFRPLFDRFVPCRLGRLVTLRSAVVMCPVLTGATRPTLPSSRPEVKPCGSPPLNLLRSAVGPCWTHTPSAVQILCRWSAPGPAAFSFGSAPVMGSCTRNSCVRLAQKASPTLHGGSQ